MNKFEEYLVELLKDNIIIEGESVEIRRQFMPSDAELPIITLDIESNDTVNYFRTYDDGVEKLKFRRSARININAWCNSESIREEINNQITSCFIASLNHNFHYCTYYDNGTCKNIDKYCKAIGTLKQKCPNPQTYGYQCLSDKYGLIFGSVIVENPFFADDVNSNPALLCSVFPCRCQYIETMSAMGEPLDDAFIDDVTLQNRG